MKPLILDYKECRQEINSSLKYEYDVNTCMSMVQLDGKQKPFIEMNSNDLELLTKTKVRQESDDDHFLGELGTKTEVKNERDDPRDTFLELATKTFTIRERED